MKEDTQHPDGTNTDLNVALMDQQIDQPSALPASPSQLSQQPKVEGTSWNEINDPDFYAREAEVLAEQQPERAALMWVEAVMATEGTGADVDRILAYLDRALDLRPHASWLLGLGRRLLMQHRRFERALELAKREVKVGGDSSTRAGVLYETSGVVQHQLGDAAIAMRLVDQALKLLPHHICSLVRTAALRGHAELHAEEARALQQLSEYLTDPLQRAQFLYAAGSVLEAHLNQDQAAQSAYVRAIEADPRNVPALVALSQMYERTQQWAPLCRVLDQLATVLDAPHIQARLRQRAGWLHMDRTGNLEAACQQLERAAQAAPNDATILRRLAQAYESKGRAEDAVGALRRLLELTPDGQGRAALLTQIANVLLEQLKDVDGAIAAYRKALEQVNAYLPALQSLGTIYRQRGDFDSLVAVSNPEVEGMLPKEARAVRYVELAEILATELDRPDEARAAYWRALELVPDLHLAFWGLRALLGRLGDHEQLAEVLAKQAAISTDVRTRTHLLLQRAQLQGSVLAAPAEAIETLRYADTGDHGRSVVLAQIELRARLAPSIDLVRLLLEQAATTTDQREAEQLRIWAGRELELHLNEGDEALALYKSVLDDHPLSAAALHGAGRILHRRGAWTDLVKLHHHELSRQPERPDASMLLCRVGRVLAEKLGHQGAAIDAYAQALEHDPSCTPALAAIEGLARAGLRWEQLVAVLERHADALPDDKAAAVALCRAAEICGWQIGDLERATRLLESAFERDPEASLTVRHRLVQVCVRQQRWRDVAEHLRLLVQQAPSFEDRLLAELELARVEEFRLGKAPDLARYESIAAADPALLGPRLQHELTRMRRRFNSDDLTRWLVDQSNEIADDALAAAQLLEAAQLDELGHEAGPLSLEASQAAYERAPQHLGVIWSLERALLRAGQWREVAQLREREAQLEMDRSVRAQRLARAAISYYRAEAMADAERVCRECLNFDAHCLAALRLLAHLADQQRNWPELASLSDRIAEACQDQQNRLSHCLHAADVWHDMVGDSRRALASLAVALADDAGQPDAFARAEQLLLAQGEPEELSGLYRRAIQTRKEDSAKVDLLRRHARLLRARTDGQQRQHVDRAISELNALVAIAPDDVDALTELAELQRQQRHWSDAAATLGQLIARAEDADARHLARLQQAELWLEQLNEPHRARATLEDACVERPEDLKLARLMLEFCTTVGDWEGARAVLERLSTAEDPQARLWAALRMIEVVRRCSRDPEQHERTERTAIDLATHDTTMLDELRVSFTSSAECQRLVQIAEPLLEIADGAQERGLRELIARVLVEDLEQADHALLHLVPLLHAYPHDEGLLLLAGRAFEARGDNDNAAARYRTVLTKNPANIAAYRGLSRVTPREVAAAAAAAVDLLGDAGPEEAVLLSQLGSNSKPASSFRAEAPQPEQRYRPLQEILETVAPYLDVAYPEPSGQLLRSSNATATAAAQLAHALGFADIQVKVGNVDTADVGIGQPLTLRINASLAEHPNRPEFRFWVSRALGRGLGGGAVMQQLGTDEMLELIEALNGKRPASESAQELQKVLGRALPRKQRKYLTQLVPQAKDPALWQRYRDKLERWADRLALVLSGHPGIGLRELARVGGVSTREIATHPDLAPLLRYTVSEEFGRLYRTVWR